MFFSRMTLVKDGLRGDAAADLPLHDPYETHRWLWGLFADRADRKRDFLYRIHDENTPVVHAVSARPPSTPGPVWKLETKPYAPKIAEGDRLAFDLRANPVVARAGEGRSKRHDVVMDAKRSWKAAHGEAARGVELQDLIHESASGWLARKGQQGGFLVQPSGVRVDGYRVLEFAKGDQAHPIRMGAVDYSGALEVTDAAAFSETLMSGIGPGKGFGFGLLLVRRT